MSEYGQGIVMTREVMLPFVPTEGLLLYSRTFDDCPEPEGFPLKDVVWDIDRQVFLARTGLSHVDYPILLILEQLRNCLEQGWAFGSYRDAFTDDEEQNDENEVVSSGAETGEPDPFEEEADVLTKTWKQRSPAQNRILRALIRHSASTYDNEATAYAFDRTGRFFTVEQVRDRSLKEEPTRAFRDAEMAFSNLSFEEKEKWRKRTKRYPSLEELTKG